MSKTALILACSSLLSVLSAQVREGETVATDGDRYASMGARSFNRLTVSGEEVAKNVKRLTKEMHWHKSLASALAAGRQQGKPVVWIQALGDLKGFL